MMTVARCETPIEAHIVKGALEQAGIPAFVAHEHFVWVNWLLSDALGGVRVQVPGAVADEARALLAGVEKGGENGAVEPLAGPSPPGDIERCPACGATGRPRLSKAGGAALIALVLFSCPVPFRHTLWRCSRCAREWTAPVQGYYPMPVILMVILLAAVALVLLVAVLYEICRIQGWSQACL